MNDKLITRIIILLSVLVIAAVMVLNKRILPVPENIPSFIYQLPKLNASINATCTIILLVSFYYVKHKNVKLHKKLNITAFILSCIFFVSYLTYHWLAQETSFPKDNPLRGVYLFILITHIILAAFVLPLILMSFYYGLQMKIEKHKKIVRFSYPIWLYVTVTGVIVYLMISPYYSK